MVTRQPLLLLRKLTGLTCLARGALWILLLQPALVSPLWDSLGAI